MKKITVFMCAITLAATSYAAPAKKKAKKSTATASVGIVASSIKNKSNSNKKKNSKVSLNANPSDVSMNGSAATKSSAPSQVSGQLSTSITEVKPEKKISLSTLFEYYASNLSNPTDRYTAGGKEANLAGTISMKYNLSKINSIGLGANYSVSTPFHETEKYLNEQATINEPFLNFQNTLSLEDNLAVINILRAYYYTSPSAIAQKLNSRARWVAILEKVVNNSRFTLGLFSDMNHRFFSDEANQYDFEANESTENAARTDFTYGLTPYVNYKLSDKFSLYGEITVLSYSHKRSDNWAFDMKKHTSLKEQTLGVEIAAIKNVTLTPKVTITAEDLRPETSYMSLRAAITFL